MPKDNTFYIGVDGGGSKLITVLFDNQLNLISVGQGGSININFATLDDVAANMEQSITECLNNFKGHIKKAYITMPGPADVYAKILNKHCKLSKWQILAEGYICLLAGIQKQQGILALSGTGSGVFNIENEDNFTHLGGWGALFGDEGSGYDIGNNGIKAAIYSSDTRGPKTVLEKLIPEHLGVTKFFDITKKIYRSSNYRKTIADLCKVVSKAANAEDKVALNILKNAGKDISLQVKALLRRDKVKIKNKDVVVSGSVWKSHPVMFETFKENLKQEYPGLCVLKPLFEPIVGPVIHQGIKLHSRIHDNEAVLKHIKDQYSKFIYN